MTRRLSIRAVPIRAVLCRAAAAVLCLLLALVATGPTALAAPAGPASVSAFAHGTAKRGHATKRSRCARQKTRRAKHAEQCRRTHRTAAKRPSTAATPAPLTAAALLTAPTAVTPPAPAPILTPAAGSTMPATAPSEPLPGTEAEPPSVPHVQVSAVEYAFTLSRTSVPAGKVILQFVNDGQDEHNLQLASEEGVPAGSFADTPSKGMVQLALEMHAGSYTLFCSLEGHEQKGMKATLNVE